MDLANMLSGYRLRSRYRGSSLYASRKTEAVATVSALVISETSVSDRERGPVHDGSTDSFSSTPTAFFRLLGKEFPGAWELQGHPQSRIVVCTLVEKATFFVRPGFIVLARRSQG